MIRMLIHGEDHGSSMVETAISVLVLLTAMLSIMEGTRLLYIYSYVSYSAREGARYAMVRGSTFAGHSCGTATSANCAASPSDIAAVIKNLAPPGVNTGNPLTVSATWPGTTAAGNVCASTNGMNSPGCLVQVQVAYQFMSVVPLLPQLDLSIVNTAAVTISQ